MGSMVGQERDFGIHAGKFLLAAAERSERKAWTLGERLMGKQRGERHRGQKTDMPVGAQETLHRPSACCKPGSQEQHDVA